MMLRSVRLFSSKTGWNFFPTFFFHQKFNYFHIVTFLCVAFRYDFSTDHEKNLLAMRIKKGEKTNKWSMNDHNFSRRDFCRRTINYFYLCLSIKDILTCMLSSIIHRFYTFGWTHLEVVLNYWYEGMFVVCSDNF